MIRHVGSGSYLGVLAECDTCGFQYSQMNFVGGDWDMEKAEDYLRHSMALNCWIVEENQVTCANCR